MDNNGTIDLKKLQKNLPPPPIAVAPLDPAAPKSTPPPASAPVPKQFVPPSVVAAVPRPQRPLMGILPASKLPGKRTLIIGVVALVVLAVGYYIYANFWTKSPFGPTGGEAAAESAAVATSSADSMSEAEIIAAVGKILLLPADETPTLAKVSDPVILQSQDFFKNATVGDVVLMYPKSLRAILFDPKQNKIIEIGPITATESGTTTEATSTVAHN